MFENSIDFLTQGEKHSTCPMIRKIVLKTNAVLFLGKNL